MTKLGSLSFSLAFVFNFWVQPAFADLKVKAYLSSQNVEVGDVVTYTIELTSDKEMRSPGARFSPPQIPGLEFQNISNGSSTSMSFVNGSMSRSYTSKYNISYAAERAGKYTFPALDLNVPEKLKTPVLQMQVYIKLPQNLRQRRQRRNNVSGGPGSLFDQFFGRSRRQSAPESNRTLEFFTDVEISSTEVYKGEQFTAAWYIYVTPGASLGTFDTLRFPTLKGFWKEDVNFASRFYWKTVEYKGKRYMRALLSSYALTPYKSGSYMIDSFELRAVVNKGFFNGSRKVLKTKSDPVAITVKPLPQPVPQDFTGGVGKFKLEYIRSGGLRRVLVGEPFEISFRVVGDEATTKFLKTPELDVGQDFKIYKVKEDNKFIPSNVSSYKLFKYTLIPKKAGVYRLPDLRLTFLGSLSGEYYDEYLRIPTFKVAPNPNAPKIDDETFEDEALTPEQMANTKLSNLHPREMGGFNLGQIVFFRLSSIWTLLVLLLTFVGSFFVYKKASFVPPMGESLAVELEKRALEVSSLLKQNKRNQALSELINILSLLVGAVNGKRYGAEREIELAVTSLPASLKSSGEKLRDLNDELQEMRFGSSLDSYTNKAKLESCLKDFKKLFLEFREYLR